MNIKGLDMEAISKLMQPYIDDYFRQNYMLRPEAGVFQESYTFEFGEIKNLIPAEYHSLYKETSLFNGASKFVYCQSHCDDGSKHEGDSIFTAMLISDERYEKALFLLIKREDSFKGIEENILLADFLR